MQATSTPSWSCASCGWTNHDRPTCGRCGIARRWQDDPALDLPPRPRWRELPSAYLALLYGLLAAGGAAAALHPGWRAALGWSPAFLCTEAAFALAGCVGALNHAVWSRLLHELRLQVPERAPSGAPFEAAATLVPYGPVDGLHVTLAFHDRYFHVRGHGRERRVQRRSVRLAHHRHLSDGALAGRRETRFVSAFSAPFPLTPHTDVSVELLASLLGTLHWLWPPARRIAQDLREHGGYVVRLSVRWGPWRRSLERKVLVYHLDERLHVG